MPNIFIRCVLVTLVLFAATTRADSIEQLTPSQIVGRWYGENSQRGARSGKQYDYRRWLRENRADGTELVVFRYYRRGELQLETTMTSRWSVEGGVYSSDCETVAERAKTIRCSDRSRYSIEYLGTNRMRYTDISTQISYTARRVPQDFRIP